MTQTALDFLLNRRSAQAKFMTGPGPDAPTLKTLLTAAARAPDHGMLEPWRFIVIQGEAQERIAAQARARAIERGMDEAGVEKAERLFRMGPCCVAVVASPKSGAKFPDIEQTLSAGAVCAGLVNAALAAGFGAQWLTGWRAYDRDFIESALGAQPHEFIAGYVHIGKAGAPPGERKRPDIDAIATWL